MLDQLPTAVGLPARWVAGDEEQLVMMQVASVVNQGKGC
jgi:hypothetical protein